MLREREAKEQLKELRRRREEGEISGYIYERGKESILRKIHYGEESGQRHRYTTRARIASLVPPIPVFTELVSSESSEEVVVKEFIDERETEELSIATLSIGIDEIQSELHISFNENDFSLNSGEEEEEEEEKTIDKNSNMGLVLDFPSLVKNNKGKGGPIIIDWDNVNTPSNYKRINS